MKTVEDHLCEQDCNEALKETIYSVLAACKSISSLVNQAELAGIYEERCTMNESGEKQQKLDVISNCILKDELVDSPYIAAIASEEESDIIDVNSDGKYTVLFDPLDGSSNIHVNGNVGTIFSVVDSHNWRDWFNAENHSGTDVICAAGYVIYGPATMLALSIGLGTHLYTLDVEKGEFFLTSPNRDIPNDTGEFSINIGKYRFWREGTRRYIDQVLKGKVGKRHKDYNLRYFGSMVGEVHRILSRGGIFIYPGENSKTQRYGNGKLRLHYEAMPMAYLVEQARGKAFSGLERTLTVRPTDIHQRVQVVLGSKNEVEAFVRYSEEDSIE